MKILEFKNQSKASKLARQLLAEAVRNEPAITKDIQEAAKLENAKVVGLENKFESESSLVRKLTDNSIVRGISVWKIAKQNNDTLRYTIIFSPENYRQDYNSILNFLDKKGYRIQKIWNAWSNENRDTDTGFRGINVTVISSQSQKFELQFHTEESFRLKTETHDLYEERRNPKISKERDAEIRGIMKKLAAEIERPKGV